MSLLSPPKIPLFRITLFYGPEAVEGSTDSMHCVFNVKKRSWKGGVQVDVVVARNQITRLEEVIEFKPWLTNLLRPLAVGNKEDYLEKGQDLFAQLVCFHKLQLFIQEGINQENTRVPRDLLVSETAKAVQREADEIKGQIVVELDLKGAESDE